MLALRQRARAFLAQQLPHELVSAVVVPFVAQRILLLGSVYFATFFVLPEIAPWHAFPHVRFFDSWLRWDSFYFMLIASEGYGSTELGSPNTFFPLYPALIRVLSLLMPVPAAALVVANLATLIGLISLYLLARQLYDATLARRAVWAALLFPTAYFFSAGYSESTYLAVAVGAYLAFLNRRKAAAIALAAAATLGRAVGAFCFSISFVAGWLARRAWRDWPSIALGPALGLALLALIHYLSSGTPFAPFVVRFKGGLFGDPLSMQRSTARWWDVLLDEGQSKNLMLRLLNWGSVALVGVAGAEMLRRKEIELAVITWLSIAVPLATQRTLLDAFSMARFALAAFPLFFVLARWSGEGNRARVLGIAGAMLQVSLAVCFATWRWAE
jgi:hypothetical protein